MLPAGRCLNMGEIEKMHSGRLREFSFSQGGFLRAYLKHFAE